MKLSNIVSAAVLSASVSAPAASYAEEAKAPVPIVENTQRAFFSVLSADGSKDYITLNASHTNDTVSLDRALDQKLCIEKPVKIVVPLNDKNLSPTWESDKSCVGGAVVSPAGVSLTVFPEKSSLSTSPFVVSFEENSATLFIDYAKVYSSYKDSAAYLKMEEAKAVEPKTQVPVKADVAKDVFVKEVDVDAVEPKSSPASLSVGLHGGISFPDANPYAQAVVGANCLGVLYTFEKSENKSVQLCLGAKVDAGWKKIDVNNALDYLSPNRDTVDSLAADALMQFGFHSDIDKMFFKIDLGAGAAVDYVLGEKNIFTNSDGQQVNLDSFMNVGPAAELMLEGGLRLSDSFHCSLNIVIGAKNGNETVPQYRPEFFPEVKLGTGCAVDIGL